MQVVLEVQQSAGRLGNDATSTVTAVAQLTAGKAAGVAAKAAGRAEAEAGAGAEARVDVTAVAGEGHPLLRSQEQHRS